MKLKAFHSPWQRKYIKEMEPQWAEDRDDCANLESQSPIFILPGAHNKLLDVVELSIFDFLSGNRDRSNFAAALYTFAIKSTALFLLQT